MRTRSNVIFVLFSLLILTLPLIVKAEKNALTGMVVGRTGEILHINLPEPVKDGSYVTIKPLKSEPAIAEARVLSCTSERPYIALVKVVKADVANPIAIGVKAYADTGSVNSSIAPKSIKTGDNDGSRFSLQAGDFQPNSDTVKESTGDYWQSYRLNYSIIKFKGLETQLSAEYNKGSGELLTNEGTVRRSIELFPVTLIGRIKPLRMGSTSLFLGDGAGYYHIRSEDSNGTDIASYSGEEFGHEFSAGFESTRGWILELRYRDVENTDIQGYSLSLGSKF